MADAESYSVATAIYTAGALRTENTPLVLFGIYPDRPSDGRSTGCGPDG